MELINMKNELKDSKVKNKSLYPDHTDDIYFTESLSALFS